MAQAREVILEIMKEVQAVSKKERNEAQKFNFRGIDAVLNVVGPALRKAGGFLVPNVLEKVYDVAPTKSGGFQTVVRLSVEFSIYGSEGEPVSGIVAAEAFDTSDKATAKAMSVALRTWLLQVLALPTDEPDADSFYPELGGAPVAARNWQGEIDALKDRDAALQLFNEARTRKAPKEVMDAITAKGKTFLTPDNV
jgi:hypothetical protein